LLASRSRQIAVSFENIAASQTQEYAQQSVGSTSSAIQGTGSYLTTGPAALAGTSFQVDRTMPVGAMAIAAPISALFENARMRMADGG
jgi:hypothetical protein